MESPVKEQSASPSGGVPLRPFDSDSEIAEGEFNGHVASAYVFPLRVVMVVL